MKSYRALINAPYSITILRCLEELRAEYKVQRLWMHHAFQSPAPRHRSLKIAQRLAEFCSVEIQASCER